MVLTLSLCTSIQAPMSGNGAYPAKWNNVPSTHTPPGGLNSGIDSHLPIQPNMYKQIKEGTAGLSKGHKPPPYYDYSYPRGPYPPHMQFPAQIPYDMPTYPQMGAQHPQMVRRNPEWSGHWGGQDMPPMGPQVAQDQWPGDWHPHMYPSHPLYNPVYRNHLTMRRDQFDTTLHLKSSHSPIPTNLGTHPMNDQLLSPARGHQGSRGNMTQNSEFPSFSPNPLSQPHLSPAPTDVSRTPSTSIPDLHREVSKENTPVTPMMFRHPGLETGNSFHRQDTPPLARQLTPTSHPMGTSPIPPTPKRTPAKKKPDPSLPFDQWVQEHGLYAEFQREMSSREGNEFYYQLLYFYYSHQAGPYAAPNTRVPLVSGEEVNLFRLHRAVEAQGGVKQVCERKEWKKIFQTFNYQSKGTAGIKSLKQIYIKWLLPFICNRKNESIDTMLELCRSIPRPRKQHNNQSDTLSVTSPAPLSEESQDIPESPASLHSGISTNCSPIKLKLEDRPSSSDIKVPFDHFNDTSHPQDPLDQTSPPFPVLNKAKSHSATSHLDPFKPKLKQEIPDTTPDGPSYPYYPHMYPEQYHVMPPRAPYPSRLMYPIMPTPPHRWGAPTIKQEDWYVQRANPTPDTSRTQSATPAPETKPRVPREKPAQAEPDKAPKRPEIASRPSLVESTVPIQRKRKKHPPNMNMTDPLKLTMALRSGVLTDTAWALDYLTILLNNNGTRDLFHLDLAPGLLDALVECWLSCLLDMFPGEISLPSHHNTEPTEHTDLPPHTRSIPSESADTSIPPSVRYLRTPFSGRCELADCEGRTEELGGEDEVLRPPENVVFLHATQETQLGAMTICISNLIRCLSFIQGNELILAKHNSLLSLSGQLLLLRHTHPVSLDRGIDTSDSQEDVGTTGDMYVLDSFKCEWWWSYLEYVREDIFVILCNMSGALDFALYPSKVGHSLLRALTHWLTCPSSMCQDPLPHLSNTSWLSPKRLVLECLSKLSVLPSNVDYILGTPGPSDLRQLVKELSKWSINKNDVIARQFVFVLLHNMCGTNDMCPHYVIARQAPLLQVLLECVEFAPPQPPLNPPPRPTKGATPQEEWALLTSLRRRAAGTLVRLSQHSENRGLFLDMQPRLLALVCPNRDAIDTFKSDPHLRQLVLEILSHLTD